MLATYLETEVIKSALSLLYTVPATVEKFIEHTEGPEMSIGQHAWRGGYDCRQSSTADRPGPFAQGSGAFGSEPRVRGLGGSHRGHLHSLFVIAYEQSSQVW